MLITVNKTDDVCDSITVQLETQVPSTPPFTTEAFLYVEIDCCCEGTKKLVLWQNDVVSDDVDVDEIVITPEMLGETTLPNGVYKFTLEIVTLSNGSKTTEFKCAFVDCDLNCRTVEALVDFNDGLRARLYYEALQTLGECSECDCDKYCTLFNDLKRILGETVCDCG